MVIKPYGLCADIHLHSWNAFSSVSESGINTRLEFILSDLRRCAYETLSAGGDTIVAAGDIFHVRGSVAPLVLNPAIDCFKEIISIGVKVILLAGNHDAELKDVTRLSSAITVLEGIGCSVANEPLLVGNKWLIPWYQNIAELKSIIETPPPNHHEIDLILHAPIDGVIFGLPEHGLTDKYLADLGYDRVFAGHYHNHKDFGNGVYSIGALAHHTWSDIGTKAGFLLVRKDKVEYRSSHAPKFIEIDENTDMDELPMIADGNYMRAKIGNVTAKEVEDMRELLRMNGAIGSVIHAIKSPIEERGGVPIVAGKSVTVEASIADYIDSEKLPDADLVLRKCLDLLSKVEEL